MTLPELKVGISVSDVLLHDVNDDGRLDTIVTDLTSGDVGILVNRSQPAGQLAWAPEQRFRAGVGEYGVVETVSNAANEAVMLQFGLPDAFPAQFFSVSRDESAATASADFTGDGIEDLVVTNRGSNSFALLVGKGAGAFVDPRTFASGAVPSGVRADDFDNDGDQDLAILNEGSQTIDIFLNDGRGNLGNGQGGTAAFFTANAGNVPDGLAVADVNDDGNADLVVGNRFGDILIILGNGDGTFRPFTRAGQAVPFVATDLNGDSVLDVLLANQSSDQALAQNRSAGATTFTPGSFGQTGGNLIGPAAVQLADLNGDGFDDYLVANTGSNNLLVYLGVAPQSVGAPPSQKVFSSTAQSFFAGTNPTALLVRDVNNDNRLDVLVANQGSNDVSVLFGQGSSSTWTLTPGPRLDTGGIGPNALVLVDQTGDGVPDLVVTNGQSGTMTMLPGIGAGGFGTGFFDDSNPTSLNLPGPIVQTLFQGPNSFALLQGGGIFQFNSTSFAAGAVSVFGDATRQVTALTAFGSSLVAGRSDSSVSVLTADAGGQFAETMVFRDAELERPSALQVIGDEVYLTNQGDSMPLVIGLGQFLALGGGGSSGLPGDPVFGQEITLSSVDLARLSLIATVLASNETSSADDVLVENADAAVVGLEQSIGLLGAVLFDGSAFESGVEFEEPVDEELIAVGDLSDEKWIELVIGVKPALEQLLLLIESRFRSDGDGGHAQRTAWTDAWLAHFLDWLTQPQAEQAPVEDWTIWSEFRSWPGFGAGAPAGVALAPGSDRLPAGRLTAAPIPEGRVESSRFSDGLLASPAEGRSHAAMEVPATLVADEQRTSWYWLTGSLLGSTLLAGWWRRRRRRQPAAHTTN